MQHATCLKGEEHEVLWKALCVSRHGLSLRASARDDHVSRRRSPRHFTHDTTPLSSTQVHLPLDASGSPPSAGAPREPRRTGERVVHAAVRPKQWRSNDDRRSWNDPDNIHILSCGQPTACGAICCNQPKMSLMAPDALDDPDSAASLESNLAPPPARIPLTTQGERDTAKAGATGGSSGLSPACTIKAAAANSMHDQIRRRAKAVAVVRLGPASATHMFAPFPIKIPPRRPDGDIIAGRKGGACYTPTRWTGRCCLALTLEPHKFPCLLAPKSVAFGSGSASKETDKPGLRN